MARHRHWHYIDRPIGHAPKLPETDGELDRQLELLSNTIGNRKSSDQQRAYALPWLIHLVADAHQPLHTVSRYNEKGKVTKAATARSLPIPSTRVCRQ